MSLSRLYEEPEIAPGLKRIYADLRASFDLPFVPSAFKLLAGVPDYLNLVWGDLGPVVRSREFQTAAKALEEFARSQIVKGGWRFSDQQRVLAAQKFSYNDVEQLCGIAGAFTRAAVQMALFERLLQKGYSGGQAGRVASARPVSAMARMMTLHVPNESEASLRAWLIYADIRRTLGPGSVSSVFRLLAPFPAYLASVWLDAKKLLGDPAFTRAREDTAKRALALLTGFPVRDHRNLSKTLAPAQWQDIEAAVDALARLSPSLMLLMAAWQRSFSGASRVAA